MIIMIFHVIEVFHTRKTAFLIEYKFNFGKAWRDDTFLHGFYCLAKTHLNLSIMCYAIPIPGFPFYIDNFS